MTPLSQWKLIFVYDLVLWLSSVTDTAESKLSDVIDTAESKLSGVNDTAESYLSDVIDTAESTKTPLNQFLEMWKNLIPFKETVKPNPT